VIIYFDSSALVKAYCLEPTSPQVLALLKRVAPPLLFTQLHAIEIRNALRLKRFRGELTLSQLQGAFGNLRDDVESGFLRIPDLDFRALFDQAEILSAAHTPVVGTRCLDILHVAAALLLGSRQFVSFDRRQRTFARRAGLAVLPKALRDRA